MVCQGVLAVAVLQRTRFPGFGTLTWTHMGNQAPHVLMYTRTFPLRRVAPFQRSTALALLGVVEARAPAVASTSTITLTRAARRVAMPVHPLRAVAPAPTAPHSLKILQRTVRGGAPPPLLLTHHTPPLAELTRVRGLLRLRSSQERGRARGNPTRRDRARANDECKDRHNARHVAATR